MFSNQIKRHMQFITRKKELLLMVMKENQKKNRII